MVHIHYGLGSEDNHNHRQYHDAGYKLAADAKGQRQERARLSHGFSPCSDRAPARATRGRCGLQPSSSELNPWSDIQSSESRCERSVGHWLLFIDADSWPSSDLMSDVAALLEDTTRIGCGSTIRVTPVNCSGSWRQLGTPSLENPGVLRPDDNALAPPLARLHFHANAA
jgi:hypothetical protein